MTRSVSFAAGSAQAQKQTGMPTRVWMGRATATAPVAPVAVTLAVAATQEVYFRSQLSTLVQQGQQ
jgi:hypothetical protein